MGLFNKHKLKANQPPYPSSKNFMQHHQTFNKNGGVLIKRMTLSSSRDFTVLRHDLLNGNIMVVNLSPLIKIARSPRGDKRILKNQLQLIKQYCVQNGGNAVKLKETTLLITPNNQFRIKPKS